MNKKLYLLFSMVFIFTSSIYGQKKGKMAPYEPVAGVEQSNVAPLIFMSLDAINKPQSDILSKEEILLEKIDFENMTFQTSYIHYVSMMMHRRVKVNYSFEDGLIHIKLTNIAVQNQTAGGEWEDSKMPVKGDKKIQAKLALKINELKNDGDKIAEAKKKFYGDLENIYVMLSGNKSGKFENEKALLDNNVSEIGKGLVVVDADMNDKESNGGKYKVTYSYTAPDGIMVSSKENISFIQYTDGEDALSLSVGSAINNIKSCKVIDLTSEGGVVLKGGVINDKASAYNFKKLVNTDPVEGVSFDDAFPVIYEVLNQENIETHRINFGGKFLTTSWVKIQDGKLGGELQGMITFLYEEDKIWPYYIQMTNSSGKNSQCLSQACKDLKSKLSEKIIEVNKSANKAEIRAQFLSSDYVKKAASEGENVTTLQKKYWNSLK